MHQEKYVYQQSQSKPESPDLLVKSTTVSGLVGTVITKLLKYDLI